MTDDERLADLRNKLGRICGNKDWGAKRLDAACVLVRQIVEIEGTEGLSELFR